ncbi:MAG: hypothetical protein WC435_00965 [Candidatus Paceibacterota bacterium]
MVDLLKNEIEKEFCQNCQGILEEEEVFEGTGGERICKSCWATLKLKIEKSKEEGKKKMDFSCRSIEFRTHFCAKGQGFNLSVKSGEILDKNGNLLPENKICFFVDISKNGFYKELEGKKGEKEITVTSTFLHKGEQYFYRLKIPIKTDENGNFLELGAEDDFKKTILPSREFIKQKLFFDK